MNSLDEVRGIIITKFLTAHNKEHSSVLVDLPNLPIVDIDNQKEPWIKVELYLPNTELACLEGEDFEVDIDGRFYVTYYAPKGAGTKAMSQYTDMLITEMGLQLTEGISFGPVQTSPVWNMNLKNWEGNMNTLTFFTVANKMC